ncbi:MAG: glycosyltransferase family 2 protein [Tepidanaerobacteraceae bacterium]|jgi:cellulose synthase/poly-beta-1,6-N-acetylglucosamine synthase-like glycosyltransferase|nr:glycosyltransferase family 2 protein [Tepidanaerobacteraceae bacterium]
MQMLFWVSFIFLIYICIGYPLMLWMVARLFKKTRTIGDITPFVSIIIAAHNEEKVISQRIENCLAIDYPKEKFEVIIASDGSTDSTNEIVRRYTGHQVYLDFEAERKGKVGVFNRAVPKAKGEIIIFSDANSQFRRDAVRNLVRHFADSRVGAVSGRKLIRQSDEFETSQGEGFYWKYESFLKRNESKLHSAMGGDGSIYAVRKELYPFPDENVAYSDDFIISMSTVLQGYRLVYDPEAMVYEEASKSVWAEFRRKIRTLSGGIHGYVTLRRLLLPFVSPVWWQLWSHRILRFVTPYIMLTLLFSAFFLYTKGLFYAAVLWVQITVYALAGVGFLCYLLGSKPKFFFIPFYFTIMNFVFVPAFARFVLGKTETRWEKMGR